MLVLMNVGKRIESGRGKENLFHHAMRLTTDHYDATIAYYACRVDQKTSSVSKEKETQRATNRYICIRVCACARAKFYQTVSTYVVVCGALPSNSSLSTHITVTIQEDYID